MTQPATAYDLSGTTPTRTPGPPGRLEAGSYTSMPPGMTHFVFTEGVTEVQLTSVGPWEIDYVDPDDDPRLRS